MKKRIFSLLIVLIITLTGIPAGGFVVFGENGTSENEPLSVNLTEKNVPEGAVASGERVIINEDEVLFDISEVHEFVFTVAKDGLYRISFDYISNNNSKSQLEAALLIDGEKPFSEFPNIILRRLWGSSEESEIYIEEGNDIRPIAEEIEVWQNYSVCDSEGYSAEPYEFYFDAGEHKISLSNIAESFKIKNLCLDGIYSDLPDYEEYLKKHKNEKQYSGEDIKIQAEKVLRVNSRNIVAANDMSDPMTYPSDYKYIKLNTLGGTNWKYVGDRAEWKIDVPESGLYAVSFRFRQSYYSGISTHRRLTVNGEVPYKEADSIDFSYGIGWQISDMEGRLLYLNRGENLIGLEAVLGDNRYILSGLEDAIYNLNRLYRQIITVTGTSPDIYRDYSLENEIPNLSSDLEKYISEVERLIQTVEKYYSEGSSETATLVQVHYQLEDMYDDPSTITKSSRLSRFKSNISSLGTWANKLREQPLEIDVINITSPNSDMPRAKAGFFSMMKYKFCRFVTSFVTDYSVMSSVKSGEYEKSVRVWVSTGRDQAQLLKNMVEDSFSPQYGISVSVELVAGGLIEAILAGKGPDIALDRAETDPVNLAMRNALLDLKQFDDFGEVTKWFCDGSVLPYEYEGGCYGLPITQTFEMLFYRTDIFEELNLSVPKTWEDMILYVLPVLQTGNMTVGIGQLTDCNIFKTLLYQAGGSVYTEDLMNAALDTQVAYETFKMAVELYTDYDMPQNYDFMNRFRTGEMPMAVGSYTLYNNLKLGAPELNGMWEMVEIPGLVDSEGNLNNTQIMGSSAAVITKNCSDRESAWTFLKWFLSAETQGRYGSDIEAILGAAGRYNPANCEAMTQLSWGTEQLKLLESQRSKVTTLPNIPGSYFTQRAIHNAFVSTVIDSANPREELLYWNEEINFELERKRIEFGFEPDK